LHEQVVNLILQRRGGDASYLGRELACRATSSILGKSFYVVLA
jgi:hypothetical protein